MQSVHRFGTASVRALSTSAKPPMSVVRALKNGRSVEVLRPTEDHRAALVAFARRPITMFDAMAGPGHAEAAADDYVWNAKSARHDALVAMVDAKVVGVAQLDPDVHEMEAPIDAGFLERCGVERSEVCVARTVVAIDWQNQGVGSALKEGQIEAARAMGYRAVVSDSSHAAVHRIVSRLGGTVQPGGLWTLVSTERPTVKRQ
ncbi:hypothetical protein JI739_09890 [Ramlibacter sp. AW1]|uniref:N-acetyltransferase domain-containing protein n=1 Tax=Ramlibacter aurantiacus TaxID=2801330 RepID=A0A936ZFP6_9BURK|nr:GNAT family N-acetyltransferase [Ramlibacter aurantiacus]MBL0420654.1 hypothetical protein [Ramlibacter aurantiacus]